MPGRVIFNPLARPGSTCNTAAGCADRPDPAVTEPGTRWLCRECLRIWTLVVGGTGHNPDGTPSDPDARGWYSTL